MTDKQYEDMDKKLDELIEAHKRIKKILEEIYPYKTKEELIKIGKHGDLKK